MPRFLAACVVIFAGLVPVASLALSVGDIDLKSALNQPFVAEIPISGDSADELASVRVKVASSETFAKYGLDRASFLRDFRFEVVAEGSSGNIEVSSRDPVVEPFVTVLLEISWPQGRLLREYTVLLDPPVFASETTAPTVEAPAAGPAPTRAQPAAPVAQPVAQPVPAPTRSQAPTPAPAPVETSAAPAYQGDTFGPVQRAETLWGIAGRVTSDSSVNRNQMMLAIYRANPEAFIGNINRLKAGAILRVPSPDEARELGRGEANAEVKRQNESWRGAADDSARLRLVPPPEADTDVAGTDTGQAAATAAAESRADELERELAETRRLLEVRDRELQALQTQLGAQPDEMPAPVEPVIEEPDTEVDVTTDEAVDEKLAGEDEAVTEEPVVPPAAVTSPNVVTVSTPDEPSFLGGLFTNIWLYIAFGGVLVVALIVMRRRSAETETAPWGSGLDADDDDAYGEESAETTQQLSASPGDEDQSFVVEEQRGGATDADQESRAEPEEEFSPFATSRLDAEEETPLERTISADSAVNLDEADPIAEADFHMAYGLYDQAADLLSNALNVDPERKELRLKLLEVYFIWENQDAFLREARTLQEIVDDTNDPDWNKVLIMGKQICPDNALFAATPSPVSAAANMDFDLGADANTVITENVDFEFEESQLDVDVSLGDDLDSASDAGGLDFDFTVEDAAEGLDFEINESDEQTQLDDDGATMESPIDVGGDSTMETPTIESPVLEATTESPTIESPIDIGEDPTTESPTIESPIDIGGDSTMETPTIESPVVQMGDESKSETTAEIELDDLGLDLSSLDADDDGEQAGIGELHAETLQIDLDSVDDLDEDTQHSQIPAELADEGRLVDDDPTAELENLGDTSAQPVLSGDTAEQPFPGGGDTAEQPALAGVSDGAELATADAEAGVGGIDFEVGDSFADDGDDTTNVSPATGSVADGARPGRP